MSERDSDGDPAKIDEEDEAPHGPNLTLIYSFVVLALIAAIGFAVLIVMPFYHRR